jgi:beta-aspartyl-peptidase (threonine type)
MVDSAFIIRNLTLLTGAVPVYAEYGVGFGIVEVSHLGFQQDAHFMSAFRSLRFWLATGLLAALPLASSVEAQLSETATEKESKPMKWSIAIHGGAGADPSRWSEEQIKVRMDGLTAALQIGVDQLNENGQAMDVVELVIRSLEDNPVFNAGRGAVLNEDAEQSLDASIMDGRDLQSGAVAGVQQIKNPISAARRVISDSPHVLLSGNGADAFAKLLGLELETSEYFVTEPQMKKWEKWKARQDSVDKTTFSLPTGTDDPLFYLGTVGCVVLDASGNLAAGTSTGGMLGKRFGRIGDSPIIGAGTYASNKSCAVSCTGVGELFIRNSIAVSLGHRMEMAKESLESAANGLIDEVLPVDSGGLIAVDHLGNIALPFNTPGMARGQATSEGLFSVEIGRTN